MLSAINEAKAVNKKIVVLGALCTMLDERTAIGPQVFETIKAQFPGRTFETPINRQVKLIECPAAHQPIQLYAPKSRGALQYGQVADEMLRLLNGKVKAGGKAAKKS
jgi:chromosome partitioning protein